MPAKTRNRACPLRATIRFASLLGSVAGLAALSVPHALAQGNVFDLGNIVVHSTTLHTSEVGEQALSGADIRAFNRETVGSAINTLPGVNLSRNSRNEETVFVRGFDSRQVPLFLDGIPQYVPYDGYVDFGRFTTFDLAEIRVAKGAASLLYGPNIMGGAINLITRKPLRELEGDVRIGFATGGERKVAANVGSNQGLWYFQAGASYLDADSFALGRGFEDHKASPTDSGDRRQNAYRTDRKASLKIGFTPNASDEYALAYSKQEGKKGNPVYTGKSTQGSMRYWQWPFWDKESLYFISSTELSDALTLKTRLYADKYQNGLDMFTDASYSQRTERSLYDDKTYGAAVELVSRHLEDHELHLALHYKDDRHEEDDKNFRDVTRSVAIEDIIELSSAWRLRLGLSHEEREAREAHLLPTGTTRATNGLIELAHDLTPDIEAYASLARKSRLPTIKDRYSYRMGRAIPNPDQDPEVARHGEIGLRGTPWRGASGEASLFYSHIRDYIQTAVVPSTACGGQTCDQAQNISRARHRGLEMSLQQTLGEQWRLGAAYTYLDRDNMSDRQIPLTDSPRHKLFAHATWSPLQHWAFQTSLDAEEGRQVSSGNATASGYRHVGSFATVNAKGVWKPRPDLTLEAGVNNLGDKHYELADGYPMPGRTLFTNTTFSF